MLAKALFDSLVTRFRGLHMNIGLVKDVSVSASEAYGDFVCIMAAVMDPTYNFIWLDVDHPEPQALETELKNSIIGLGTF